MILKDEGQSSDMVIQTNNNNNPFALDILFPEEVTFFTYKHGTIFA